MITTVNPGDSSSLFGYRLDLDSTNTRMIVGSYNDNGTGPSDSGSAFIYLNVSNDWVLEQEIHSESPVTDGNFGKDVAIDSTGTRAIVGEAGAESFAIFVRDGTTWTPEQTIVNPFPVVTEIFGGFVDISANGDRVVVGSRPFSSGSAAEAVFVYSRSGTTWILEDTIYLPVEGAYSRFFGQGVSIDDTGERIFIGSHREETLRGAAYIYTRSVTTWTQEQRIPNPSPTSFDYFGMNINISGDGLRCIVGAYDEDDGGSQTGACYIFTRDGVIWTIEKTFYNPSPEVGDRFGLYAKLDTTGERCLITATRDNTGADQTGTCYTYTRAGTTWTAEDTINNPVPVAYDKFGLGIALGSNGTYAIASVYALSDVGVVYTYNLALACPTEIITYNPTPDTADTFGRKIALDSTATRMIVGNHNYDSATNYTVGAVYIYRKENCAWILEQTIINPNTGNSLAAFGVSVAITEDGDRVAIGESGYATGSGRVHTYTRTDTTWTPEDTIDNPEPGQSDYFGNSVNMDATGTRLVTGAHGWDAIGYPNAGKAYVFLRTGSTYALEEEFEDFLPTAFNVYFGIHSDIDDAGDRLVLSAYREDVSRGAIHIYRRSDTTWTFEQRIQCPVVESLAQFGREMSISGDGLRIAAGAYQLDAPVYNCGSGFIFSRDGIVWDLEEQIFNPTPVASDFFGYSMLLDTTGETCIISCHGDDTGADAAGIAYVFTRSGISWSLVETINNPVPEINDNFSLGQAIAANGVYAIGNHNAYDESVTYRSGLVYTYDQVGAEAPGPDGIYITPIYRFKLLNIIA